MQSAQIKWAMHQIGKVEHERAVVRPRWRASDDAARASRLAVAGPKQRSSAREPENDSRVWLGWRHGGRQCRVRVVRKKVFAES
jgi:hypothetical protein